MRPLVTICAAVARRARAGAGRVNEFDKELFWPVKLLQYSSVPPGNFGVDHADGLVEWALAMPRKPIPAWLKRRMKFSGFVMF